MTQQNLLKLAKQGNPKALAAILNQSLKSKNITAKVGLKENCLQILLESTQLPDQYAMVSFIRRGLTKLGIESIQTVKVYGRQLGEESPAWNQAFEMGIGSELPSSPEPINFQNLVTSQPPHETPSSVLSDTETSSITEPIDFQNLASSQTSDEETPPSSEQADFQNLLFRQTPHQTPKSTSSNLEMPSSTRQTNHQSLHSNLGKSQTSNLRQPIGPLSVGNVVSAALVLYRSHLKTYLQLALRAYLWALVPVYGWAKYFAISGMISRLAFGEVTSNPEPVSHANRYVNQRLWSFFRVAFQVFLLLVGVYLGLLIACYLGIFVLGFGLGFILSTVLGNPIAGGILMVLITIIGVVSFIFGFLWFASRWLVAEIPLAVEETINGKESIDRSWELTKNSVRRIQGVFIVAFLVSLPIVLVTSYIPYFFLFQLEEGTSLFRLVYFIYILTSIVGGIFILPFWQAIKAVLYYDLRSRREGLGLRLRDSM